ncbi:hypothetical protein P3W45_001471 [Vairimorpha bombi]|jgi:glucose-induced degradation protein 4
MVLVDGAVYSGEQLSTSGSFKIEMKIDKIDMLEERMCGTFSIYNLTSENDKLSTYYESAIIGNKHSFYNKYEDKETDELHWRMFPEWKTEILKNKEYDIKKSGFLYLRMKELFILPDPNVESVEGASIEGYYYCCYYKKLDFFSGHYFYKSDKSQLSEQILLERVYKRTSGEACLV